MTALEQYREDRQNRREPEKRIPRQEYYLRLRDTLLAELTEEGRSDFLEEMISAASEGALPALEFAALRECFAAVVDGRRMKDASVTVPHILRGEDQPLTWAELEKGPAFRVDDPQMHEMLLRLRNVSRHLVNARDDTAAAAAEKSVSREIAGLKAVNHALESDNAALRKEREELRARIAALEEGVISQQLQNRVDNRRHQLEDEIAREAEEKRESAEFALREALLSAARAPRETREEARRAAEAEETRRAAECARLREEVQGAIAQQLQSWQQALQAADTRFLAKTYAELRGLADRTLPELLAQAPLHGADETLLRALADHAEALENHLLRMEQALLQMGLQLCQPQVGEPFDPARHSPAAAPTDGPSPEMAEVEKVESPGMRLLRGDGQAETLVWAVVHLRRRTDRREGRRPRAGRMGEE